MYELISGAIMLGFWMGGLLLYFFYQETRERLLFIFSIAFWLLGLERLVLGIMGLENEPNAPVYLMRLAAFMLIIFAIIDANRPRSSRR